MENRPSEPIPLNLMDAFVGQLNTFLSNDERVTFALDMVLEMKPPLDLLEKHAIPDLIVRYKLNPKTAELANSVDEYIKELEEKNRFGTFVSKTRKMELEEQNKPSSMISQNWRSDTLPCVPPGFQKPVPTLLHSSSEKTILKISLPTSNLEIIVNDRKRRNADTSGIPEEPITTIVKESSESQQPKMKKPTRHCSMM